MDGCQGWNDDRDSRRNLIVLRLCIGQMELVAPEAGDAAAGVFPAVGKAADVEQTDRSVGHNFVAALACPLAECKVIGEVPPTVAVGTNVRSIIWHERA